MTSSASVPAMGGESEAGRGGMLTRSGHSWPMALKRPLHQASGASIVRIGSRPRRPAGAGPEVRVGWRDAGGTRLFSLLHPESRTETKSDGNLYGGAVNRPVLRRCRRCRRGGAVSRPGCRGFEFGGLQAQTFTQGTPARSVSVLYTVQQVEGAGCRRWLHREAGYRMPKCLGFQGGRSAQDGAARGLVAEMWPEIHKSARLRM